MNMGGCEGSVEEYDGGYSAFVLAKAGVRARPHPSWRRNNLIRKELAWLRRGAPARTTKPGSGLTRPTS